MIDQEDINNIGKIVSDDTNQERNSGPVWYKRVPDF